VAILITKGWGFTVVYFTKIVDGKLSHHLALYSTNGEFLKTKELTGPIKTWSTAKSADGFDHIVMVDEKSVYCFEAYYLEVGKGLHRTTEDVIAVAWLEEESIIALVNRKGRIVFCPFSIR
jgi:hypothetical protein